MFLFSSTQNRIIEYNILSSTLVRIELWKQRIAYYLVSSSQNRTIDLQNKTLFSSDQNYIIGFTFVSTGQNRIIVFQNRILVHFSLIRIELQNRILFVFLWLEQNYRIMRLGYSLVSSGGKGIVELQNRFLFGFLWLKSNFRLRFALVSFGQIDNRFIQKFSLCFFFC